MQSLSLDDNDFESFASWGEIKDLSNFENLPENLKKFFTPSFFTKFSPNRIEISVSILFINSGLLICVFLKIKSYKL